MKYFLIIFGFLIYALPSFAAPSEGDLDAMRSAFSAAEDENWVDAYSQLRDLDKNNVGFVLLDWMRLTNDKSNKTFDELKDFIESRPGWPNIDLMKKYAEQQLSKEKISDDDVIAWFRKYPPKTLAGSMAYIRALNKKSKEQNASTEKVALGKLIRSTWVNMTFQNDEAEDYLRFYGPWLSTPDHIARADRLAWDRKVRESEYMLKFIPADKKALYNAKVTLIKNSSSFTQAYNRVPKNQRNDPLFTLEFLRKYNEEGKNEQARRILLALPRTLPRPELWWKERETQIRRAIKDKQYASAYVLAKNHSLKEGTSYANAEFLAGWIGLRYVKVPADSAKRFTDMYRKVETGISKSRAAYWAGRSYESMGQPEKAKYWYGFAAKYPATFYGQLALYRLGRKDVPYVSFHFKVNDDVKKEYEKRELTQAVNVLMEVGSPKMLKVFLSHVLDKTITFDELRILVEKTQKTQNNELISIAKSTAERKGLPLIDENYPVLEDMVAHKDIEPALVHAIILQESSFNEDAVSSTGARGLMQVMPGTADYVARKMGIRSSESMVGNADHNLVLGQAYLKTLSDRFDGNYVYMIAGYNGGPTNVDKWRKDYGEPNMKNMDEVIDWIEKIPFPETRNYVNRVLENLIIYRQKMSTLDLYKPQDPTPVAARWCLYFCQVNSKAHSDVGQDDDTINPRDTSR